MLSSSLRQKGLPALRLVTRTLSGGSSSASPPSQASSPELRFNERGSLAGRVAVVTGGHRGLGESICLTLASLGADIIVLDRNGPGTSELPSQLAALGRKHTSITVDLSNGPAVSAVASQVLSECNGIDILVNNAGVSHLGAAESLSQSAWDATLHTNLRAPFLLSSGLFPALKTHHRGSIINVSSTAAIRPLPEHIAYCASKAGLHMLTRCMAAEWGGHGVRVNAVAPTVVLTEMGRRVWGNEEKGGPMKKRIPKGRFAEPFEIADAVAYLAGDLSTMVNGAVLEVDGGFGTM